MKHRRFTLAAVLAAFLLPAAFAQVAVDIPARKGNASTSVSGSSLKIDNPSGVLLPTFAEKITGAPSTVSIVIKGCMTGDAVGDNCTTLETNTTTTARQIRNPTTNSTVYDYFLVIPSWTGGTAPSVTINSTLSPNARNGGSGGGGSWGSITGTLASQTDLETALNLLAPIASPAFTGNATISGNLAVGSSTAPSFPIELHSTTFSSANFFTHNDTNFQAPAVNIARSHGTQAAPTAVANGDTLGYFSFQGYDSVAYSNGGQLLAQALEAFDATHHGTQLKLTAVPLGSNVTATVFNFNGANNTNESELDFTALAGKVIGWSAAALAAPTTGFSRLLNGSVALGNGTQGDTTGLLTLAKITTSGSNGGFDGTEGTGAGLTCATGHDLLWPDSTAHRWKMCNNNGAAVNVIGDGDVLFAPNGSVTNPSYSFTNCVTCGLWITAANGSMVLNSKTTPMYFQINGVSGATLDTSGVWSATTIAASGALKGTTLLSQTNCAGVGTAANPSVVTCSTASAGAFSCATNASAGTCTVNTTAVTANSEIFVTQVVDEGTRLSVTCNTGSVLPAGPLLASKSAGTFTINLGTVTTNPGCFDYHIVN